MIVSDFSYNGQSLSDFGMMSCVPENGVTLPSRNIDSSELSPLRNRVNIYSAHYGDTLIIPMTIVKNVVNNLDIELKDYEFAQIKRWLESNRKPMILRVTDCYDSYDDQIEMNVNGKGDIVSVSVGNIVYVGTDSEQHEESPVHAEPLDRYSEVYYVGVFNNVQPYIIEGTCYGVSLEFKCESPYGYIDANDLFFDFTSYKNELSRTAHCVDGGYLGYVSPVIEIKSASRFGSEDYVVIKNKTTGENMRMNIGTAGSSVNIDCEKKIVLRDGNIPMTISELGYTITSDIKGFISSSYVVMDWLKLVNGNNDIAVEPHSSTMSTVTIKYRNVCNNGGLL